MARDTNTFAEFNILTKWVKSTNYKEDAKFTFLDVADSWLIAHARAHNYVVVTYEVAADTVKNVKIPNACMGMGVQCIAPFNMLRQEGARFILDQH